MAGTIGLLGGTFDPPHHGHLVVASEARQAFDLAEVRFLVAGDPWMKEGTTPAAHRVAMARLATADDPAFVVDTREVERDGPTYTFDTLSDLHDEGHDDLVFLLGADAAALLPKWHRVDEVLALARFVAVNRAGYDVPVEVTGDDRIDLLTIPDVAISSTDLRRRFAEGRPVRYHLPDNVIAYVREHGLYGAAA